MKIVKLQRQEYLINPVEKAPFRKQQSRNTFLHKRDTTTAKTPNKSSGKLVFAGTMTPNGNGETAEAKMPYKPCRKSIILETACCSSDFESAATRIPYKTNEMNIVLTTEFLRQRQEVPVPGQG